MAAGEHPVEPILRTKLYRPRLTTELVRRHRLLALMDRADAVLLTLVSAQNKEIADQLSISTHTVDDHLKHIFQKLHVRGRRPAVCRAAELGLLGPGPSGRAS